MALDERELERRRASYLTRCVGLIAEHGWMVQGVFPGEDTPAEQRYSFAYTAGLTVKALPELITFGLAAQVAQTILNDLAGRMVDGQPLAAGSFLDDLIVGYRALLIEADDPDGNEFSTLPRTLFGSIRLLQLVFQDAQHRWPWQPGYAHSGLPVLGQFSEQMKAAG